MHDPTHLDRLGIRVLADRSHKTIQCHHFGVGRFGGLLSQGFFGKLHGIGYSCELDSLGTH